MQTEPTASTKMPSPLTEATNRITEQGKRLIELRNTLCLQLDQAIGVSPEEEEVVPSPESQPAISDLDVLFTSLDLLSGTVRRLGNELNRLSKLTG